MSPLLAPSGILVANMETPPTHLEAALVFQVRSSSPPTARHNASKCTVRARTERFSGGPSTQRVPCNAGEQPRLFSPLKAAFSGFYPLSSPNTPLLFGLRFPRLGLRDAGRPERSVGPPESAPQPRRRAHLLSTGLDPVPKPSPPPLLAAATDGRPQARSSSAVASALSPSSPLASSSSCLPAGSAI